MSLRSVDNHSLADIFLKHNGAHVHYSWLIQQIDLEKKYTLAIQEKEVLEQEIAKVCDSTKELQSENDRWVCAGHETSTRAAENLSVFKRNLTKS